MSAHPTLAGSTMADCWPMARVMAGQSAVPVGHAVDLAFFFPDQDGARHDALIAETRRHLGGCLNAVEIALRLALDDTPGMASALSQMADPLCWPTVRAQSSLIGPALLAHMQMRAGIGLMLRQSAQPDGEGGDEAPSHGLPTGDSAIDEALSALALAEGRWLAPGGEDQPMRPDLPAEHFAELVWTVAACLSVHAQHVTGVSDGAVPIAIERAAWPLLAAHDERIGPVAAADELVRRLGDRADAPDLMGVALGQRRFLLFAALAARRLRMASAQVTAILVLAPVVQVAALCRALGGSNADFRHLLLALRPVRPHLTDAAIVAQAGHYQSLSESDADAQVRWLRTPATFRAKLDHLRQVGLA